MTTQSLTAVNRQATEWSPEQTEIVRRQLIRGGTANRPVTDAELAYFAQVCRHTNLDPFRRQVWGILRGGELTIQTSIDGYRAIAQRSGQYQGQVGPHWCGEDGQWVDIWLKKEHPAAARVGVFRKGFREPVWGIALWSEYALKNMSGTKWGDMPTHMLAKCAEANAIRKCFSEDLGGIYTAEEMSAVDAETGEVIDQPPAPRVAQPIMAPEHPSRYQRPRPDAVEVLDSDGNQLTHNGQPVWAVGRVECITTHVKDRGLYLKSAYPCQVHTGKSFFLSLDAEPEAWAHQVVGAPPCYWVNTQSQSAPWADEDDPAAVAV